MTGLGKAEIGHKGPRGVESGRTPFGDQSAEADPHLDTVQSLHLTQSGPSMTATPVSTCAEVGQRAYLVTP